MALHKLLEKGSDTDLLREAIGYVAQSLMNLEVDSLCGAEHGEHKAERVSQCNGYHERAWDTRAGTIALQMAPKAWFWREAQFDTLRLGLIKLAARGSPR